MISSIRIQNFQSHEDTEIHFHPGLCLIVGSGDSGKTSIHRALRWVQSNRIRQDDRPMGDGFISRWAKKTSAKGTVSLTQDCRVTVTKPEGSVTRFRDAAKGKNDKETNGYMLNGERFEAIGVGVPDAVSQFFTWSDVNVQKQHDQAFLLSKGAGEVASFLNRTVRLDTIDAHIQAASSLVRSERDTLKLLEVLQTSDQKALDALAWVPGVQGRMEALDAVEKALLAMETQQTRLAGVRNEWGRMEARVQEQDAILAMEPRVQKIRKEWDWFRGILEKGHKIREIVGRWETVEQAVRKAAIFADFEPKAQKCRELWSDGMLLEARRETLRNHVSQWSRDSLLLSRADRVIVLEPRVQGLRELYLQSVTKDLCAEAMAHWVREWAKASKTVGIPVDWEDLEFRVKKVRALARRRDGIQTEKESIGKWALTFAGLETIIQRSTETLAALEAGRPETCPLCNGPMHKEHGA